MVAALHANGNMDEKAMRKNLDALTDGWLSARERIIAVEAGEPAPEERMGDAVGEFRSDEWWKAPEAVSEDEAQPESNGDLSELEQEMEAEFRL